MRFLPIFLSFLFALGCSSCATTSLSDKLIEDVSGVTQVLKQDSCAQGYLKAQNGACVLMMEPLNIEPKIAPQDDDRVMIDLTDIDDDTVKPIIEKLKQFKAQGRKDVWIRVNSFGGSVDTGHQLMQVIEGYGSPITCISDTKSMSMGFYILQSCDKRLMTKRSVLMAHQPSTQIQGNSQKLRDEAKYLDILMNGFVETCVERMAITKEEFLEKTQDKIWYMGWEEALRYKAIDGTISPRALPSKLVEIEKKPNLLQLLLGGKKI